MKKKYWIPIIGYFLMSSSEHDWRSNTPDKELVYSLWELYQFVICIATVGCLALFI